MSRESVEKLMERCRTDAEFRAKLRAARRAFVEHAGFELNEREWEVFDAIDWSLSDEELLARYGDYGVT